MTVEQAAENTARHQRILRLLALIRSIAGQMQIQERDAEQLALHFAGRVGAIGRAALTPIRAGTDFESLVLDELRVDRVHRSGISVGGPAVRLNAKSAELLGLLIHELVINSVKFGALSQPQTRLRVAWWFAGASDSRLRLEWQESGVRMPPAALRKPGFGSHILKRVIASELRGEGELLYLSHGVLCTLELPIGEVLLQHE